MSRTKQRTIHRPHTVLHFRLTADQARQAIMAAREAANSAAHLEHVATLEDIKSTMAAKREAYTDVADTLAKQFNSQE